MVNKRIIVLPCNTELFNLLKENDELILDGTRWKDFKKGIPILKRKGIFINTIIFECETFKEVLDHETKNLECKKDIYIRKIPSKSEYFSYIETLSKNHLRYVLPLHNEYDILNIKLLNSLKVRILIDLRDSSLNWELLEELIIDNLLSIGPRAPLDPFTMLVNSYKTKKYDLSSIYYENISDYIWIDNNGKVAFTKKDLENKKYIDTNSLNNIDYSIEYKKRLDKKYQIMLKQSICAFCEGFCLCNGYLLEEGKKLKCRQFFKNFFDILELKIIKQEKSPNVNPDS